MCVFVCWATGSVLGAEARVGAKHALSRPRLATQPGGAAAGRRCPRRVCSAPRPRSRAPLPRRASAWALKQSPVLGVAHTHSSFSSLTHARVQEAPRREEVGEGEGSGSSGSPRRAPAGAVHFACNASVQLLRAPRFPREAGREQPIRPHVSPAASPFLRHSHRARAGESAPLGTHTHTASATPRWQTPHLVSCAPPSGRRAGGAAKRGSAALGVTHASRGKSEGPRPLPRRPVSRTRARRPAATLSSPPAGQGAGQGTGQQKARQARAHISRTTHGARMCLPGEGAQASRPRRAWGAALGRWRPPLETIWPL